MESHEDDVVTIEDAVEEMKNVEEESIAVFGAGEENVCTYSNVSLSTQRNYCDIIEFFFIKYFQESYKFYCKNIACKNAVIVY